jgi:hypothetical protein
VIRHARHTVGTGGLGGPDAQIERLREAKQMIDG